MTKITIRLIFPIRDQCLISQRGYKLVQHVLLQMKFVSLFKQNFLVNEDYILNFSFNTKIQTNNLDFFKMPMRNLKINLLSMKLKLFVQKICWKVDWKKKEQQRVNQSNGWSRLSKIQMFERLFNDWIIVIIMNYSQQKPAPKLLMQISRNEEVPKLVSFHDVTRRDTRNRLLTQARNLVSQTQNQKMPNLQNIAINRFESMLQEQRGENQELRVTIKELTNQIEKIKQINEGLIVRIKQVETSYRNLRKDLEQVHEQDKRKQKNVIFNDVEEYVKMTVERVMLNLKQEKMNPSLENKLDRFMAELMEINAVSVEQLVRKNKGQDTKIESVKKKSRSKVQKYRNDPSPSKDNASREQYASIMQRLVGEQMSKSYAGVGVGGFGSSQDSRLRNIYATTPQKRRRIFQ